MKVPLLDLKAQYKSLKPQLDEALLRVAESQYFILGPEVDNMEQELAEFLGCKYAYGVSSGTDALLLALMALDIKPGDEVIVPTFSFFATAGVVSRLNAKPVFVDADPVTFNIDVSKIEQVITPRTKAIIPVHLFGQSADMAPIMAIAQKFNLWVIEDGAQAISTQYQDGRCAGTIGTIGCYSFFPSKNLGCFGDGGLVVTNDEHIAYRLKIMRVHGGDPKYIHKVIGGNFRIDALQAAIIRVKLPHLNAWSAKRRANAKRYTQLFIQSGLATGTGNIAFSDKEKVLLPKAVYQNTEQQLANHHIYNQYCIRVPERDTVRDYLAKKEIGTEIYYPVPFHLQECFADLGYKKGDFPEAEKAADSIIALPIFPELTDEQIEFTVAMIGEIVNT
jgi:dTDP-4-amino-4,6-dideoxygalactose transaminase